MKFIVSKEILLLQALELAAPDSSRSTLRSWLKEGRVTVDGATAFQANQVVCSGQTVQIGSKAHFLESGVQTLYRDKDLIVIDKPQGLLSVSTDFEKTMTAHAILKRHFYPKKVHVVHRLDQGTSGVMLFVLSDQAFSGLKSAFETHDVERRYAAIVEGHLDESEGTWRSYLYEDANYHVHATQNTDKGELAVTHFRVKKKSKKMSWLDLQLETGKKNQIRVHCADAGCPIVGDKKYGAKTDPFHRLCLHAYFLGFEHPVTKKTMRFESKLPEGFK